MKLEWLYNDNNAEEARYTWVAGPGTSQDFEGEHEPRQQA